MTPDLTQAPADWCGPIVEMGEPYEPAPTTDADLDADPEPDGPTHGFTLRPHRWGGWAVYIHGDFHRLFRDFGEANAYLAAAEADWQELGLAPERERRDAFTGHAAQEGGAE